MAWDCAWVAGPTHGNAARVAAPPSVVPRVVLGESLGERGLEGETGRHVGVRLCLGATPPALVAVSRLGSRHSGPDADLAQTCRSKGTFAPRASVRPLFTCRP